MPSPIEAFIPDAETLLALQAEDLAAVCLAVLHTIKERLLTRDHLTYGMFENRTLQFPHSRKPEIEVAIAEAWQWLENEGLIVNAPDQSHTSTFFIFTRRGRQFRAAADVTAYRSANLLPKGLLADVLEEKVRPMFLRGDYDTAVFHAFKEVEIEVRRASGLPADLVGVPLMRKAFDSKDGPLRSISEVSSERESIAHLFAGTIGYLKNPGSHREVTVERASAARLIMFASELLSTIKVHEILSVVRQEEEKASRE